MYKLVAYVARNLCGDTSFICLVYLCVIFCIARTDKRVRFLDRKKAFESEGFFAIIFSLFDLYSNKELLTSSEKYSISSFQPLRIIFT